MITIKRETDYACRVILHLAMLPHGTRATAREIARHRVIPRALVRRVITRLAAAGLITTVRGGHGGLSLARASSQITLLQVVQAMEGKLAVNACVLDRRTCPLSHGCAVNQAWCRVRQALIEELGRATFDDLARPGAGRGK